MSTTIALTANALKVLERRYLAKDHSGKICELPGQMIQRVATAVALPAPTEAPPMPSPPTSAPWTCSLSGSSQSILTPLAQKCGVGREE